MDRFIAKVKTETDGQIVGDLEIVWIPLDLYRPAMRPACSCGEPGLATTHSLARQCS